MKEGHINKGDVQQIAVEYLKATKYVEKVEVSVVEQDKETWIVRGTCPIDLAGHPWAEKFELTIDNKGKVKSTEYALL
jgi:hypothetical protein